MKKWIILCLTILFALAAGFIFVYRNATDPLRKAQEIAIEVANEETELSEFHNFELYHGEETYYVLTAKNLKGEAVYVWISEKDQSVLVHEEKNGVNKDEAIQLVYSDREPEEIIEVRLGVTRIQETERPAWEIYYRSSNGNLNYYYVDFISGEKLRAIDNF